MKLKSLWLTALCGLVLIAGLASCSDNNKDDILWRKGSKVTLPEYRGFILNEGSYGKNNSHFTFFDPLQDTINTRDLYELQNNIKLGDTANDMLVYDGDVYIIVNVSQRIVRLNGSGVQQAVFNKFQYLGQPRYGVISGGKLYVTCYGGYVARFDAKTLTLEDSVKVDANPEEVIAKQGKLYCVNSGWGAGHTISEIDIQKFDKAVTLPAPSNPQRLKEANGNLYMMSSYYDVNTKISTSYVWTYDLSTQQYVNISNATNVLASGDNLYMAKNKSAPLSQDLVAFTVYNAKTKKIEPWNLKNIPAELLSSTVYMMEQNPFDGSFYIGTSDYVSNGTIYHFDANGNYKGKFSAGGINPNSMVFLR